MELNYPEGATPLSDEDLMGLIPSHITLQRELNEWEFRNISQAQNWLNTYRGDLLNRIFIARLHKQMFDQTWKWAGKFRTSNTNIGVDKEKIQSELYKLLDDVLYWLQYNTYRNQEIAVRFHHRLVKIHLFPNGNGRHARLACDKLLTSLNEKPFTWGNTDLTQANIIRSEYINALRTADQHDYKPLLTFLNVATN